MKKLLCLLIVAFCIIALFACTNEVTSDYATDNTETAQGSLDTYQDVLDYYTIKIKEAVPVLIEEYDKEATVNQDGLIGLAEINTDKTVKLAEISNEGVTKMAEIYYNSGSGKYSEYEEWAGKLMAVYTEEAGHIYDAYMKSAMD